MQSLCGAGGLRTASCRTVRPALYGRARQICRGARHACGPPPVYLRHRGVRHLHQRIAARRTGGRDRENPKSPRFRGPCRSHRPGSARQPADGRRAFPRPSGAGHARHFAGLRLPAGRRHRGVRPAALVRRPHAQCRLDNHRHGRCPHAGAAPRPTHVAHGTGRRMPVSAGDMPQRRQAGPDVRQIRHRLGGLFPFLLCRFRRCAPRPCGSSTACAGPTDMRRLSAGRTATG